LYRKNFELIQTLQNLFYKILSLYFVYYHHNRLQFIVFIRVITLAILFGI